MAAPLASEQPKAFHMLGEAGKAGSRTADISAKGLQSMWRSSWLSSEFVVAGSTEIALEGWLEEQLLEIRTWRRMIGSRSPTRFNA